MAGVLDRALRRGQRHRAHGSDLLRARDPPAGRAGHHLGRRRARGDAARGRPGGPGPGGGDAGPPARAGAGRAGRGGVPRPAGDHHDARGLGDSRCLPVRPGPHQARSRDRGGGARPALRPQRGGAAAGAAGGPEAVRDHRAPGGAVDTGQCGGAVLLGGDRRGHARAPHRGGGGLVARRGRLRGPGGCHLGVGHRPASRGRVAARRAERHDPAGLRHLARRRRRAPRAERRRDGGGQGEAGQAQAGVRALDLDRRGAHRTPGAALQRPLQQPGAACLRRAAPATAGRQQRHQPARAPAAGDLAHHRRGRHLHRPRGRGGQDVQHGRRGDGAETPRADHEGDDGGAGPLPGPGQPGVPAALPQRPHPGGGRDQLQQGPAATLPGPRRHGDVGLHHHHPLGLQVHPGAGRVRARADPGCAGRLRHVAGEGRRRRPAHPQAHRAHEGGATGQARRARQPQGRPADHRRDRRRPADRGRGAGVQEALVRHQHERPEGRGAGRLAARVGPARQGALHRPEPAHPAADPGLGHAHHQHAGRDVHPATLHAARGAGRARHPRVRRLGVRLRRHPHRAGAATVRPLQAGHPLRRVRQRARADRHVPLGGRRRLAGRPAPPPAPARAAHRAAADRHRPGQPSVPRLPARAGRAHPPH